MAIRDSKPRPPGVHLSAAESCGEMTVIPPPVSKR